MNVKQHSGNASSHTVLKSHSDGMVKIRPSQNPNPLTVYDNTKNWLYQWEKRVTQNVWK